MTQPTVPEMLDALRPHSDVFADIVKRVEHHVLKTVPELGPLRKVERAQEFHRGMRYLLQQYVHHLAEGYFRVYMEPEGRGLDALVCLAIDERPFLLRFGRLTADGQMHRAHTGRQCDARRYGTLSSGFLIRGMEQDAVPEMAIITLAYEVENDEFTIGNRVPWYVSAVHYVHEQEFGVKRLEEIARYSAPIATERQPARIVPSVPDAYIKRWKMLKRA